MNLVWSFGEQMARTNEKKVRKIYESNIKIENYFKKVNETLCNEDQPPLSATSNPIDEFYVQ